MQPKGVLPEKRTREVSTVKARYLVCEFGGTNLFSEQSNKWDATGTSGSGCGEQSKVKHSIAVEDPG